jgi:two-component system OmpR family response regulator
MRVLVVEDEPALAAALTAALGHAGFAVDVEQDGERALRRGSHEPYDAVVLDLGLPKLDGVTVLQRWRAAGVHVPVLVLTARARWPEKLSAFSAGADDYVTKPFEIEEVVVRLRALMRRAQGHASPELECGPLRMDPSRGTASVGGAPVRLTAREMRILEYLLHRRDRIVTRGEIFDHVYDGDEGRDSNVLDVLVGRIRRKLGADLIETVRGVGYKLRAPAS